MDQAVTRTAGATPSTTPPAAAAPRLVGEFQGYVDGQPSVVWADRKNMPTVGSKLFALPPRAPAPRSWAVLLTSENHGTVGPVGCTFPWAGEKHERVQVMEIVEADAAPAPGVDLVGLVRVTIDGTVIPLATSYAPVGASSVLTDERIEAIWCREAGEAEAGKLRIAFARAIEREVAAQAGQVAVPFDFHAHLARQAAWSEKTFGPGPRTKGVCDHIRKELLEIEADPLDLREWIDVVILGLDGAWRCGGTPEQIIAGIVAKQTKNEGRTWPDWRTADPDKAIEHDRSKDAAQASTAGGRQEGDKS